MVIEKFTKLNIKDQVLARFQLNLERFFFQLYDNILLKGELIEGVDLSGSTEVSHSLGRTPRGFLVVDKDAAATIHKESANSTKITLNASSACVASIWVF